MCMYTYIYTSLCGLQWSHDLSNGIRSKQRELDRPNPNDAQIKDAFGRRNVCAVPLCKTA